MAEPFIGQVELYGFTFAPENWAPCKGQLLQISANQALFSLLGNAYGGDGRTTYGLPDLRGTLNVSQGLNPVSTFDWNMGDRHGAETHTLSDSEMPEHSHLATYSGGIGDWQGHIKATTEAGNSAIPTTGCTLATANPPGGGPDKAEQIYYSGTPASNTLVELGGSETFSAMVNGNVTVGNNGSNQAFSLLQSALVMNFSIAQKGLYPSRN
ncbi:phage tail protein [Saccharobesus litoralis]|uniref:Phage tail protein n=1 Tax=Saccharobesus litoralis TaxID=2172099 RepID=A0A2S0VSI8_9ALTE|nr:tail fiber protein [Saccharobesus litoralis]AWB67169.1 phage tail protein [Saccharobesus litoralis]